MERVAGIYVRGDDGKLVLNAGRDLTLTGAQVVNSGSGSQTVLSAGRDLNLTTVTTSASDNLTWDKNNWLKQSTTQQVGSEVAGGGDILMMAGRDVSAQAATVEAGSSLAVSAGATSPSPPPLTAACLSRTISPPAAAARCRKNRDHARCGEQ